jgi:DnaJ like chaperone protein
MLDRLWGAIGGAGLGLAVGGPLGALIGAAAGHVFIDRSGMLSGAPDRSIVFTTGLVALSAKMARSDGVVTGDEVAAFRRIVTADDGDMPRVQQLFDLAKGSTAGFEAYAAQLSDLFQDESALLEDVLDGLFVIAAADGVLHEAERAYLIAVAEIFGVAGRFDQIEARHVVRRDDPHRILGVAHNASDADVRRAWLALVAELHPDKAVARGLPPEAVAIAQERLAVINTAYERLQARRRAAAQADA